MTRQKIAIIFASLIICVSCFIVSCKKDSNLNATEENLNIVAPSGLKISTSVEQLKSEASLVVTQKIGKSVDFTITDVKFLPVKKGYSAIVEFRTKDGIDGNYAVNYDVEYQIISKQISTDIPTSKGDPVAGKVKITISCAGTCGCKVSGTIEPNGTVHYGCSCSDCTATVEIS